MRARRRKSEFHAEGRWVPRWRWRVSRESLHKGRSRKHEWLNTRKVSPRGYEKSRFHAKSDQTRYGNGGWKMKGPLITQQSEISHCNLSGR